MSTQYYVASTADGFIADEDDRIDWLLRLGFEEFQAHYDAFITEVGAIVMGSRTYEFLLGEGPSAWTYGETPTWVLTSRDLPLPEGEGVDVRFADAKVADLHEEMIAAAGERNLWVIGGGNVASQFAEEGLLDELLVTVVPVVLGEGKPLFDRRLPGGPMQLTGTTTFDTGMVELRYEIRR